MINIQRFFTFVIIIWTTQVTFAQENNQIINFTNKIDTYLETISTEGEIASYKTPHERKIIIKGNFSSGKNFHRVVKIYKSGLKKETTKIYGKAIGVKFLIAKIVRINDTLFFAKYYETKLVDRKYVRLFEETIFDQKIYNKIDLKAGL
ncbi:MAG: hypothetical protein HC905_21995 [Bacteroidales bacterium]|nr:hypothetical protein [Bacteroidales bacterium]